MAIGAAEPDSPTSSPITAGRLDSWKEIASYLGRSVRTVTRWKREQGLPVHRHQTGAVYAYKSELDAWWHSRGEQIEREPPAKTWPSASRLKSARIGVLVTITVIAVLAATAGVLLSSIMGWLTFRSNPKPAPKLLPLTTYPGIEGPPSLSPDGSQVVFARNGDLFIKQVDGEAFRPLTNTPEAEGAPAWSPDGRLIAFRRGALILTVSPLGGSEQTVIETRKPSMLTRIAWTADSQSLIFSELTSTIGASLFLVSIATGEKRQLTSPSGPGIGDGWPSVSPDGRTLAFARYPTDDSPTIYLLPLSGGEPRPVLNNAGSNLYALAWSPDGREIIFSSDLTGFPRLWRIGAKSWPDAAPQPVASAGENARFPAFSRAGSGRPLRLAYQRFDTDYDLRKAELEIDRAGHPLMKPATPFLSSTQYDANPQISPVGKRIAFVSQRSGAWEIWLADADGSNLMRLTSMGTKVIAPRWSPDGRQIAFFATTGRRGEYQMYRMNAAGGLPVRLSRDENQPDFLPSWSLDSGWIIFGSGRSGMTQIWKMPASGGAAVQITKGGGGDARDSPDGSGIYYTKVGSAGPGLWRVNARGEETKILDAPRFGQWDLTAKGVYFVDFGSSPPTIQFFDFQTHETAVIGKTAAGVQLGFAVSPDDRWLVYVTLARVEADLMLVDNYK